MNIANRIKAYIIILFMTFFGCNAKQDKSVTVTETPKIKTITPDAVTSQNKPVSNLDSSQDKKDAQIAALHVINLMQQGDFTAIYKDSADGFKKIGSEGQFFEKFQQTRKIVGTLKNPHEISFKSIAGYGFVFVYQLENDHYKSDIRITLTRSPSGKIELAGLNQHDELKK